ncbi:HAD-IA family hydrolase [Streptomyces longhuiensis]|uniref:HAD-IA family hydrolase n=1 Tax=Streptomyces longhuiensis TaxID=2880933 RepID=UPI003C6EC1C8
MHVVTELVGTAKPDPSIYRLALECIGLPAERCVFADDHAVNLPPAIELGIATMHVTDRPRWCPNWRPSSTSLRFAPREPNCGLVRCRQKSWRCEDLHR